MLVEQRVDIDIPFDRKLLNSLKRKEVIWFLTGHGPFRASPSNFEGSRMCRFCGIFKECPYHLIFNCSAFDHPDFNILSDLNISMFEEYIVNLVSKLYSL